MNKYLTIDCKLLFVDEDWLVPGTWCCWWRSANGAIHRRRSVELPDRKSREEAQRDLDAYAARFHFPEVDE
jgi:hypothetical protein